MCPRERWLPILRRAAFEAKQELCELRCSSVTGAIRRAPSQAGVGADGGRVASLHAMPLEGKIAFTQLFGDMEALLAVPMQMLCNLLL